MLRSGLLVIIVLASAAFAESWCSGSDFCNREFDCRLKFTAAQQNVFYDSGPLDFTQLLTQCGAPSTILDSNSFAAVKGNVQVPVYSYGKNQNEQHVLFESMQGAGDYYIYFDSGSGRASNPNFKQPAEKIIYECSNPAGSAGPCISIEIPAGHTNVTYTASFEITSGQNYQGTYVDITQDKKTSTLQYFSYSSDRPDYISKGTILDPQFPAIIQIYPKQGTSPYQQTRIYAIVHNVLVTESNTQQINLLGVEQQSKFEMAMSEVFLDNTTLAIKNNGPESFDDLEIISDAGELNLQHVSFQPFEEKEILFSAKGLKSAAYNVNFDFKENNEVAQRISKKFLLMTKTIENARTNFTYLGNSPLSTTKYYIRTVANNTDNIIFTTENPVCDVLKIGPGETSCLDEKNSVAEFLISKTETENSFKLVFKNPFDFQINVFEWNFKNNRGGIYEKSIASYEVFEVSYNATQISVQQNNTNQNSTNNNSNSNQNNNNQNTNNNQNKNTYEKKPAAATAPKDFDLKILLPKQNSLAKSLSFAAFVDKENVNCSLFIDGNLTQTFNVQEISFDSEMKDGEHVLDVVCDNGSTYKKTEKVYFTVASSENVTGTTPHVFFTADAASDFAPFVAGAAVLLLMILILTAIYFFSKRKGQNDTPVPHTL